MQSAFSDFFMDLDQGWEGMALGFAQAMKQMLADALAAKLMEAIMGGGKGGDSGGLLGAGISFLGSLGGGTSVGDAIISPSGGVITTHPDDYLIATKDPAAMVANITGKSEQSGGQTSENAGSGVNIINVVDPSMVEQYMSSSAGTKVIMNSIANNSGEVKGVLG
jgi:hypothetical protein